MNKSRRDEGKPSRPEPKHKTKNHPIKSGKTQQPSDKQTGHTWFYVHTDKHYRRTYQTKQHDGRPQPMALLLAQRHNSISSVDDLA